MEVRGVGSIQSKIKFQRGLDTTAIDTCISQAKNPIKKAMEEIKSEVERLHTANPSDKDSYQMILDGTGAVYNAIGKNEFNQNLRGYYRSLAKRVNRPCWQRLLGLIFLFIGIVLIVNCILLLGPAAASPAMLFGTMTASHASITSGVTGGAALLMGSYGLFSSSTLCKKMTEFSEIASAESHQPRSSSPAAPISEQFSY